MKTIIRLLFAVFLALFVPVIALATDAGAGATVASPPDYIAWITTAIAAITSILAIWQAKEKTTARKVSETLVVAIEQASKIPEVAAQENKLKAKIREVTTNAGVEPLVNRLVKLLT